MKFFRTTRETHGGKIAPAVIDRRKLVMGAGAAAAAAVAVQSLHTPVSQGAASVASKDDTRTGQPDGYQLTQHVLRYYETTKV